MEHARCVEKSAPPDFACASCGAAILKSINDTSIGQLVCAHIAKMPELAKLLPPVPSDPAPGLNGHVEENCEPRGETVSQTDTRDIYKRPNASLRIIETDAAMVSQVSIDGDDTERQAHEIPPRVLPVHIPGQSPAKSQVSSHGSSAKQAQRVVSGSVSFGAPMSSQSTTVVATPANVVANQIPKAETRIDVGMSKANVDRTPIVPLAFRRERGDMRAAASTSMRKALKLGNRRLFDLRKLIKENKKQVAMAALFVFCIVAVALLMTDDEDVPVTAKPVVEEFQMPHIRVNPALIGHKEDRIGGDAHG